MAKQTVVVLGASGLLGRAVYKAFSESDAFNVIGTAFSRARGSLVVLDVTSKSAVEAFLATHKPAAVISCAAERRPDVAEKDKDGAHLINVTSVGWLAKACKDNNAWFCYLSTDYVFDGTAPPYEVDSVPNPLNYYGQSKYLGEQECVKSNPESAILRIPLLYGDVEWDDESAVNCLVPIIKNKAKPVIMDDFQLRFPTNVVDAASALLALTTQATSGKSVKGIYHFCAQEQFTKYQLCTIIADLLQADISHLTPLREAAKDAVASRPFNAYLSNKRIEEEAGIKIKCADFKAWWADYLKAKGN
ncbi:Methionine adenosyltransferase 2 subunit beta [Chytriomyces hyalinus]|nr:Methionine adenosyltransferase 2 subunit beta [Chytriomyces hyalinus]